MLLLIKYFLKMKKNLHKVKPAFGDTKPALGELS